MPTRGSLSRSLLLFAAALLVNATAGAETVAQVLAPGATPQLSTPWAVAADPCGNLHVTGINSDTVIRIQPDLSTTTILDGSGDGSHPLLAPEGVETDASCNVFVIGRASHNAFKVEPGGTITQILDASGDGASPFRVAGGIAVGGSGAIYISGVASNNVFQVVGTAITEVIDASGDGVHPLREAGAVEVDVAGNVYVAGFASENVFKIAPGGAITQILDASGDGVQPLRGPTDVAADAAGNVFVTGRFSNNVFKVAPDGTVTRVLDVGGDGASPLLQPTVVKTDPAGNSYVVGTSSHNLFRIAPGGGVTELIDIAGDGATGLVTPVGASVAADGTAYVAGTGSSAVFAISPGGAIQLLATADPLADPMDVAVDRAGNAFVTGFFANNLTRIAPDGTTSEVLGSAGDGTMPLAAPIAVAVDFTGHAFVAGLLSDSVHQVQTNGSVHAIIDSSGDGIHPLHSPADVAVDGSGGVYVVGQASDNVFRVRTRNGHVEQILDATGDGTNPLEAPVAVAVDRFDNVFVAGEASDNVFRLAADGGVSQILDATGGGAAPLLAPSDLTVGRDGVLYVAGAGSNNVLRVTSGGVTTQVIDAAGDGTHPLVGPGALAVDAADNLYVLGVGDASVFRVTPQGEIRQILDGTGGGVSPLVGARRLAVDGLRNAFVTGGVSNNVLRVSPDLRVKLQADSEWVGAGESFDYSAVLENPSASAQNGTLTIEVRQPDLTLYGGSPVVISLPPGASYSTPLALTLPPGSPFGFYQIRARVSQPSQLLVDSAELDFELVAPGPVFTDVTGAAGLSFAQLPQNAPPNCLQSTIPGMPPGFACVQESVSGAAATGDVDGDGCVDLYVTRPYESDLLFRNRCNGTFEDITLAAGLGSVVQSSGAGFADIDNDGDLDLYVTTLGELRHRLYVNDGSAVFSEDAVARGAAVETAYPHWGMTPAFGDYDRSGWVDLYIPEWNSDAARPPGSPAHARLLRGIGGGHFEDATLDAGVDVDGYPVTTIFPEPPGLHGFAPTFVDLDGDGWQELAIASDSGTSRLFWSNGDGTFVDGTLAAGLDTSASEMGSTFGDFDGDLDLDWFVTAVSCEPPFDLRDFDCTGNRLYRNEGGRHFSDQTDSAGVRIGHFGWGAVFFDYDNDGDLDLAMVNGMVIPPEGDDLYGLDPMRFFRNDGGTFHERSGLVGLTEVRDGKGVLTFDYDQDGDLDLFLVNTGGPPVLYRNDGGNANDFLRVRTTGTVSNREGLGARITVTPAAGGPSQLREIGARSHFHGQSERTEHFGLGPAAGPIHEVRVFWPRSGIEQVYREVPPNTTLVSVEADPAGVECGVAMSDPSYAQGQTVTIASLRLRNLTAVPAATHFELFLTLPAGNGVTAIDLGGAGGLTLPAGADIELGPVATLSVGPTTPVGSWSFACRLSGPNGGPLYNEDEDSFAVE